MDDKTLLVFLGQMKDDIIQLRDENKTEHKEVINAITTNREEFVIFKTKVNTRTALISASIGAVVLISSLLLNIAAIKDRKEANVETEPIELVE